jgi:AraC-like DNA-binding protein
MIPLIRSACLNHYPEIARLVGLDPELMLKKAKLPLTAIARPDMRIAVAGVRRLFEMSAAESGCQTFGLRVAGRGDLSDLGPVALVVREQPTIGTALQTLSRFLHIHHEGMVLRIERHDETVILTTVLRGRAQRQATEAVVATLCQVMRALYGPTWRPLQVHLMHSPPADRSSHRQFFGCDVHFDADFDGIVCKASDMERTIPWADPKLARYVQSRVDELYGRSESFDAKVGVLVRELLPSGDCRIERVAEHLSCDRRTIHRRLADCGTTFSEIVDTERAELAARLVEDRATPLAGMAELLGFSAQSAMARWFRHRFGCSITQWRKDHRPDASFTSPQPGEMKTGLIASG